MRVGRGTILKGYVLSQVALFLFGCGAFNTATSDLTSGGGNGTTGGTGISNTFDSPCELGVGDIMPIEFGDSTGVSVDFSCVEAGEKFILAIGSHNTSGSGTSMQLAADIALPEPSVFAKAMSADPPDGVLPEDEGYGPSEIMSAWLRASESELHTLESEVDDGVGFSASKAMGVKAAGLGETETFRVLSSLTSTTSYVEVTGEVRCVGSEVVFYIDTTVSASVLSDDDVDTLCTAFDGVAADEQGLLGDTSDVDSDGKTHVLMTKQINRLGALGGGIITGYFYAGDLYSRSGSNPVSNEREIIYTMVPDPSGTYGTAVSNEFAMSNLLPAVLPHELQHAINYNQHVFVGGGAPEENWLNEGLSHFMEDWAGYGVENPSRYATYLASPSTYGVVTQGSPNLLERGAVYLLVRFLYEQASDGDAFIRSLEQSSLSGVDNLETAVASYTSINGFSEIMGRWVAALSMTDRGISQDSRYVYRQRVRNATTGNWEGACMICDADDNRGTELTGPNLNQYYGYHTADIDASTAKFFDVSTSPSEMTLTGTSGGGNFGLLIRYQ